MVLGSANSNIRHRQPVHRSFSEVGSSVVNQSSFVLVGKSLGEMNTAVIRWIFRDCCFFRGWNACFETGGDGKPGFL
jgi:hypothetical protein